MKIMLIMKIMKIMKIMMIMMMIFALALICAVSAGGRTRSHLDWLKSSSRPKSRTHFPFFANCICHFSFFANPFCAFIFKIFSAFVFGIVFYCILYHIPFLPLKWNFLCPEMQFASRYTKGRISRNNWFCVLYSRNTIYLYSIFCIYLYSVFSQFSSVCSLPIIIIIDNHHHHHRHHQHCFSYLVARCTLIWTSIEVKDFSLWNFDICQFSFSGVFIGFEHFSRRQQPTFHLTIIWIKFVLMVWPGHNYILPHLMMVMIMVIIIIVIITLITKRSLHFIFCLPRRLCDFIRESVIKDICLLSKCIMWILMKILLLCNNIMLMQCTAHL